ncbi:MAG TPA: hypothetical protein VJL58_07155 [Pyrinomonadaceae bacterium]|nr:hypothetical protein [Pyrinomonadaceae bacterium]
MSESVATLPTKQQFLSALNSEFHVELADGSGFEVSLVKCDEIVSNDVQENFSLLFKAPLEAPPFQGIYRLMHRRLGGMDLFIVPVKKDEHGLYYEAVFNHLLQAI